MLRNDLIRRVRRTVRVSEADLARVELDREKQREAGGSACGAQCRCGRCASGCDGCPRA